MDNSVFFYTYSTIAQTLAAAFGFSIAIVVYQIQGTARTIREYADLLMKDYSGTCECALLSAILEQDWTYFLDNYGNETSKSLGGYESYYKSQIRFAVDRILHIKKWFYKSLCLTGVSIGLSILVMSITGKFLTPGTPESWYVMYFIAFLAFASMATYSALILIVFDIFNLK
jgi:hypothetical protein